MPQRVDRQRLKEVFALALERPKESRYAFLDTACGDDAALRGEVESLLDAYDDPRPLIERNDFAASSLLGAAGAGYEGRRFGRYRVVREVGCGGMGAVYLAERADGEFEQRVALKVVRRGFADPDLGRRFLRERQILATLSHENIARLLDGGVSEDGEPYLAMEFVEGSRVDDYCDANHLSARERLRLFLKVCDAVAYAHQRLVVHRDLKPSNILVTPSATVKLLDFGIAKILDAEQAGDETRTEHRAFTPKYAAPEQVGGGPITTAADVYSLGVLLRNLLGGDVARRTEDRGAWEGDEASAAVTNLTNRPAGGGGRGLFKAELRNMVAMATREEPDRRYASVEQFAEDVRRYLRGLPVRAQKDSFTYRAGKFVRRNRAGVAAASVVALSLVAGVAATMWQAGVARAERDRARAALVKAERVSAFLSTALSYSDPSAAGAAGNNRRDATINQMLDDVAPRVGSELADQPEVRASLESTIGSAYLAQTRVADAERYLNPALAEQLRLYGEVNAETGRTILALGNALNVKGDYDAAAVTTRRAIAVFRSLRAEGTPDAENQLAKSLLLYGDVMWTKGDYAASETAYAECLSVAALPQVNDPDLAASARSGVGYVRYAQGRHAESADLLREVVAAYRASPRARWRLCAALNFLGQVLTYQGKYEEALAVLDEGEALSREQWGENSFDFARSLLIRAYALCFKGDYAGAGRTLGRVEELVARNFPGDKVTQANVHDVRGMILTRTGRAREGEAEARRATELYQSLMVRGANGITLARMHWAESLSAQRRYEEAERLLLDAYRDASQVQGAGHLRTRQVARELVRLYEAWGKPEEAARFSRPQ